jgi:hypothetical protein
MGTVRECRDELVATLRQQLEMLEGTSRFPLDRAVQHIQRQRSPVDDAIAQQHLLDVLNLFEVTSVSAALAIKGLGSSINDTSGIRDALVDLWGRTEAARSLLFDVLSVWAGDERNERTLDIWETARLLAPDAIAIAMRLSEPVSQYVEFASKVISQGSMVGGSNPLEIPRA